MGLIMSVILVERVVQVTIDPRKLRDVTQVEGHLGVVVPVIVIPCSDRIQTLVEV